jgi:hypothetical protein
MMNAKIPQAVQDCHECIKWVIPQLDKFPRNRRFTLGERIESGLLDVLGLLLEASYSQRNTKILHKANTQLTLVRHLWRLCFELKVIAKKQYEYGSKLVLNIGSQIGGWQKHASQQ